MIARSLRWRLVLAMAVIIAAVLGVAGLLSSIIVKSEFDRFLTYERRDAAMAAAKMVRAAPPGALNETLRRVHAQFGVRSFVFDGQRRLIDAYPEEVKSFDARLEANGVLKLNRRRGGRLETLMFQAAPIRVGDASVFVLPPAERSASDRSFRVSVDRRILAGIAIAAAMAILVVITLFRRVFAPVEALTAGARALADGNLAARVDVKGEDEIAGLAASFNSMAAALERNERARRNMVGDVAHELRTPLTNIRAQIEAAQDGLMAADAKFLASIQEDATLLARLVDDLQQLSLAEAGQLVLELEEIEVADVIERAMSGLDARGLAITRDVARGLRVRADARRLVQVVRNLVVNAIAHANSAIHIRGVQASGLPSIEISVADDGPGVAPEHAERIFDRFYRADASRSRATGGAGLGLAIAKELVELHGGTIRYEKPAFIVRLPSSNLHAPRSA